MHGPYDMKRVKFHDHYHQLKSNKYIKYVNHIKTEKSKLKKYGFIYSKVYMVYLCIWRFYFCFAFLKESVTGSAGPHKGLVFQYADLSVAGLQYQTFCFQSRL